MTMPTDPTTSPDPSSTPAPSNFANSLNTVLKSAPELGHSPGLSVSVASAGGDVQGNAEATARGVNTIADTKAHQSVSAVVGSGNDLQTALDWFGNHVVKAAGNVGSDVIKGAEQVGSTAMNVMNAPMKIVQHEYRYLHDVEARHGQMAAVLEGLGIAAGAVAGGLATGDIYGAELGAEAVTGAETQLFYRDSWDRTNSPNYVDPNTHQQVSIGRDLISELGHSIPGLSRNTPLFHITSGLIDGLFDMSVGGTEVLGLAHGANSAAGLGGLLGDYFPGKAPQTLEDFDNLLNSYSGTNVRRAFGDMAHSDAATIGMKYPTLARNADFLKALGDAHSGDDVAQVFRDIIRTQEITDFDKLPTLSLTRVPLRALHYAMYDSNVPGVARLARDTTRLPDTFDDVAQHFTQKDFDPVGRDAGAMGVMRTALFTEDLHTSASITSDFINADLRGKVRIWKNLQLSTLFNMAGYRGYSVDQYLKEAYPVAADADAATRATMLETRRQWAAALDQVISSNMLGKDSVYGLGVGGYDLSRVFDTETGEEFSAGITGNQTGRLSYLDLNKARRAAAMLAGHRGLFGRADDFAFDHLTQPVFKRFVLLSPSYALHIALAEVIPNALRLGLTNLARGFMYEHLADMRGKVEEGEASAIAAVVWKTFDQARHLLPEGMQATTERRLSYMTDLIASNDGHLIHPALNSGHNYGEEIQSRDASTVNLLRRSYFDSPRQKMGDNFGIFGTGDNQRLDAWQASLHEAANDPHGGSQIAARVLLERRSVEPGTPGTQLALTTGDEMDEAVHRAYDEVADHLRTMPERDRGAMARSLATTTSFRPPLVRPPDMDQYDDWAHAIVDNVRGLVQGGNGTINDAMLDHIVAGDTVSTQELKAVPVPERPPLVKGRQLVPNGDSSMQRFANNTFRHVLNPMVNFLSRQPIAAAEYMKWREFLQDSVDQGILDDDQAHVQAEVKMVNNVIKNVHNLTDRTQWTVTFRNFAPFYFAQEQAYRRMGRLLAENPRAFRQYQLMISSMHNIGQVFSGKDGNGYLVLPGTGWMTKGAVMALGSIFPGSIEASSPVGMGWNLSSSSVIFPLSAGFRPDVGPLLSIPVAAVAQFFPETVSPVLSADLQAAAATLLGPTSTESIYAQMVPNTIIQRLLTAASPNFDARSFNSTMMQTLATLDYEGRLPPADANYRTMQTFIDRVQMQTRILYITKAIVGALTPVSPELTDPIYQQFSGDLAADITAKGSVAAGLQEFLHKHPDATPFTAWQSQGLTGTTIPSSVAAEEWINNNLDLINKYPNAGILLMPNTLSTKYNATVYNEQIAQNLRSKLDPGQWTQDGAVPSYIDALYIASGNSLFYKWYSQYEAQIKGLTGTQKYDAEQAFWGSGSLGSGTVGKYGSQNPVWFKWFNSDTRETQRGETIKQMRTLLAENPQLKTPIADHTRSMLAAYKSYENTVTTNSKDGASSTIVNDAKDGWVSYLQQVVAEFPEMTNVVTALFMSIDDEPTPTINTTNAPGVFSAPKWNSNS